MCVYGINCVHTIMHESLIFANYSNNFCIINPCAVVYYRLQILDNVYYNNIK